MRRSYLFSFILILLTLSVAVSQNNPSRTKSDSRHIEKPRYNFRPVETQKYQIILNVDTKYFVAGDTQKTTTFIKATARVIPFKIEQNNILHLMVLLDGGKMYTTTNDNQDSTDMLIWETKRIELVMRNDGVIKQVLEIEKLPPLPIPGFAKTDDNGLRVLLSSFFPRLPDSISFSIHPIITIHDSSITTFAEKTVSRMWTEKNSYALLSTNDTSIACSFKSRLDATEMIYPKNLTPAQVSEDHISDGNITLSKDGKLLLYQRRSTIYRSIHSLDNSQMANIEETTEIHFALRKI